MPTPESLAWISLLAMAAAILGQAVYVGLWAVQMQRPARTASGASWPSPPAAAVILCVRGVDPSLSRCLAAIDRLEWPDFELFVGLDSSDDPAWDEVQRHVAAARHCSHVCLLDGYPSASSPKCALLARIVEQLEPRFAVVAMVDADCIVAPDWLQLLVTPLADPAVGAVSGTRWFEPPDRMDHPLGTTVRNIWNAAAIVQMHLYGIVWGGSMALRRETILRLGFPGRWRSQLCEDTCIADVLREAGLRVVRPPTLLVINEETTPLAGVRTWIERQLLTVRLYSRHWPLVAAHGLLVGSLTVVVAGLIVTAGIAGRPGWALALAAAFILYVVLSWALLIPVSGLCYGRLEQGRLPHSAPSILRDWIWWLIAIPVTQVWHLAAVVGALVARRTVWRQVAYRIRGRSVAVEKAGPFKGPEGRSGHSVH